MVFFICIQRLSNQRVNEKGFGYTASSLKTYFKQDRMLSSYRNPFAASVVRTKRTACVSTSVRVRAQVYKVTIEHEGKSHVLDVDSNTAILDVIINKGISVPHDCRSGVCMQCSAKLVSFRLSRLKRF